VFVAVAANADCVYTVAVARTRATPTIMAIIDFVSIIGKYEKVWFIRFLNVARCPTIGIVKLRSHPYSNDNNIEGLQKIITEEREEEAERVRQEELYLKQQQNRPRNVKCFYCDEFFADDIERVKHRQIKHEDKILNYPTPEDFEHRNEYLLIDSIWCNSNNVEKKIIIIIKIMMV
jgi:hypothetical protein